MQSTRLLDGFDELGSLEMDLEVALERSYEFGELGFSWRRVRKMKMKE